jgi:GTP 3',8-cyclase
MGDKVRDQLNRPLRDLRISVIDQCNFRCQYCMPVEIFDDSFPFLSKNELLSFDEIVRIATLFARLGVEKIRITGGEPLLRKDLHILIQALTRVEGIKDIALTTNGVYLPKYAVELKKAGLQRVNISLDSLDDEKFAMINGRGVSTKPVIKGIHAAKEAGLGVKINMVVKKGMNDDQIIPMAQFCKNNGLQLRFIEYMDVGSTNGWTNDQVITMQEIMGMLKEHFRLETQNPDYFGEVAKRFRYKDSDIDVGFISSVSQSFCSSCTRARISANGHLFTCLFNGKGHDLRNTLRDGSTDEEILRRIEGIWRSREDRYSDERFTDRTQKVEKVEMSYIGG